MQITPFIDEFDLETRRVIGVALEMTCLALRTGDCNDGVREAIAIKIIELTKTGQCNPDMRAGIDGHSRAAGIKAPVRGRMTALLLKRASASRPSGEWNDDDFDVLADGVVVGRIFKANASPVGMSWMWNGLRSARGPHADAWLCRDARRSHDRLRQELAAGVT
jgi:hypothetical protein